MKVTSRPMGALAIFIIILTFTSVITFLLIDVDRNKYQYVAVDIDSRWGVGPGKAEIFCQLMNDYGEVGDGWRIKGRIYVEGAPATLVIGPQSKLGDVKHKLERGENLSETRGLYIIDAANETVVVNFPVEVEGQYGLLVYSKGKANQTNALSIASNSTRFTAHIVEYNPSYERYVKEYRQGIIATLYLLIILAVLITFSSLYLSYIERKRRILQFLRENIASDVKSLSIIQTLSRKKTNVILIALLILLVLIYLFSVVLQKPLYILLILIFAIFVYLFPVGVIRAWEEMLNEASGEVHTVVSLGVLPSVRREGSEVFIGLEISNSSAYPLKDITVSYIPDGNPLVPVNKSEYISLIYPYESEHVFFKFKVPSGVVSAGSVKFQVQYFDTGTRRSHQITTRPVRIPDEDGEFVG
ncbi:MAG: hypothetical protein J7L88_00135 [Thermoplasmata archaeon]|nr:hypothetical protein [Thermoplasmata archaeon]